MSLSSDASLSLNTELAIELSNVSYRYEKKSAQSDLFISNWQVTAGQKLFLRGESGSGKTTLLNLIAGVLVPDFGEITLLGEPFSALSARKRDVFRAKHIGVVYQQFNLIPFVSVLKNVQLAAHFGATPSAQVESTLAELLPKLALSTDCLAKQASHLSVGQQQRIAIVRALINHPDILLVDEPTSALDAAARDSFMEVLIELCDKFNTTLLFVSHDSYLQQYFKDLIDIAELNSAQGEGK